MSIDNYCALDERLLSNCFALGRLTGLTCNIDLMTDDSAYEYYGPILEYCPLITFLYNPSISYALNGGFSVHI